MTGRSVTGRETLAGDNERGGIRSKIEEKLSKNVEGQETMGAKFVICESNYAEEDGENSEAHELNRFPANGINQRHSHPTYR